SAPHRSFLAGFMVCCLSGLFSSALNFSYAFGGDALDRARALGASRLWSTGVVTALAVSGGFISNLVYCGYLLRKNRTLGKFTGDGAGTGWVCGTLMGLFWFGGQSLYAIGITWMGQLGVVIGWPLLMGMIIVTSNAAGVCRQDSCECSPGLFAPRTIARASASTPLQDRSHSREWSTAHNLPPSPW